MTRILYGARGVFVPGRRGLSRRLRDLQKFLCRSANPRGAFVQASTRPLPPRQDGPQPMVVHINTSAAGDRNRKLRYNATKSCDVSDWWPRGLDGASAGFFAASASPCSRRSGGASPSSARQAGSSAAARGGSGRRRSDRARVGSRRARGRGASSTGRGAPPGLAVAEGSCPREGLRRPLLRCHELEHAAGRCPWNPGVAGGDDRLTATTAIYGCGAPARRCAPGPTNHRG